MGSADQTPDETGRPDEADRNELLPISQQYDGGCDLLKKQVYQQHTQRPGMKRTSLSPDFELALQQLFGDAAPRKKFFFRKKPIRRVQPDIVSILEEHDPAHVSKISTQIRSAIRESHIGFGTWNDRSKKEDIEFARSTISAASGLDLALSTAWSGYVREEALNSVPEELGPFGLALVFQRLNDWVPEVRTSAVGVLERFAAENQKSPEDSLETIFGCIELLLLPRACGRMGERERAAVARLISFPGVQAKWRDFVLTSPLDRAVRYCRLGLVQGWLDDLLLGLAEHGVHIAIRRMAFQAILKEGVGWKEAGEDRWHEIPAPMDKDKIANKGLHDRSMEIQRVSLQYVLDNPESPLNTEATYRALLSSPSSSISNRAAFGIKRLGVNLGESLTSILEKETPPPYWAARLLSLNAPGSTGAFIYDAYKRVEEFPHIPWLECLAHINHSEAIDDLSEIALHGENLALAHRASKALMNANQPIAFTSLRVIAETADEFEARGLKGFLTRCSAIEITRIIATLTRASTTIETDGLWRLVSLKRNRGAFLPKPDELVLLAGDVKNLPSVIEQAEAVLGLELKDR